ncbi:hypothetical protein K505DRAFT_370051 [Melanomma pulvis-pyrius CBS 109.77]|uniref:Uncharacterized protein n=1 Tax=Melanomma pulvis-pyrius CBS 109.77 TaxID=1314802 RepID=A0A6A6XWB2_9PLEO|nr:hypothetical protein K505DRAFT_370051 [Melanomma pulvis-pyrius CBS 109.77]
MSSTNDSSSPPPIHSLIDDYYKKKPNFTQYIRDPSPASKEEKDTPSTAEPQSTEELIKQRRENLKVRKTKEEVQREFYFGISSEDARARRSAQEKKESKETTMPVHPKEEETTGGNITDQVAKESDHSTASDHPIHDEAAHAQQAHKGNPGPVSVADIGKPASKEELKKRAEELNK